MPMTKLGAFWFKKLPDGREFTNGEITINGVKTPISLISNKFKTEDKHPDWIIILDEFRAQQASSGGQPIKQVGRFGRPASAPAQANNEDEYPVYDPSNPGSNFPPPNDECPF
ncbi:MAG: hypothetical protein IMZ57_11040 [Acidobacteria bacterium]|nr:hypothetical protein [Acidobacteriota bacterium]